MWACVGGGGFGGAGTGSSLFDCAECFEMDVTLRLKKQVDGFDAMLGTHFLKGGGVMPVYLTFLSQHGT